MNWFLGQSIEVQIALVAAVIGAIGVFIALLQFVQSRKKESANKLLVKGDKNKTVNIGGNNSGDINIK